VGSVKKRGSADLRHVAVTITILQDIVENVRVAYVHMSYNNMKFESVHIQGEIRATNKISQGKQGSGMPGAHPGRTKGGSRLIKRILGTQKRALDQVPN
jgi:hypothetical protein